MKNIYLDTVELQSIEEFLEESEGEFSSLEMESSFDRLNLSLPENIEKAGKAYLEIKAREAAIKAEIDRLRHLLTKEQTKAGNIKISLKYAMDVLALKKIPFDLFSVSVRKTADKLPDEIDQNLIPPDCFEVVPETWRVSRAKLLKRCKANPIEGIELLKNRTSIVIS